MEKCDTLANLQRFIEKPKIDAINVQLKLLDQVIPSYNEFLRLLSLKPPAPGTQEYRILIFSNIISTKTVSSEAVFEFVRTRLYEWDPTLKNRIHITSDWRGRCQLVRNEGQPRGRIQRILYSVN